MLHFANVTDMVQGRPGPFRLAQPQVLYNSVTSKYIMWTQVRAAQLARRRCSAACMRQRTRRRPSPPGGTVTHHTIPPPPPPMPPLRSPQLDDASRSLGLAAVAVSSHANGPFEFVRSFYPDGNETHDQTLLLAEDGVTALLARTYYADVEYVMPDPVMQPLWESVKHPGGHDNKQSSFTFDGSVNYGLNYHRAFYHPAYDDVHDIYVQRWRSEDVKWQVVCVNQNGRQRSILMPGQYTDVAKTIYESNVCNKQNSIINSKYITTNERMLVVGVGDVGDRGPVLSRFKDPSDPQNNFWRPSSVPRVKAQPWGFNYLDGKCGRRDFTGGMSRLDPGLADQTSEDRGTCTNVADNPVHQTAPDQLVGIPIVVETRRAKYVAVSRLTEDYLDTSGVLATFEGELEGEMPLADLLSTDGGDYFQWTPSAELDATFEPQIWDPKFQMESDWDDRFYQFHDNFNDRAWDSPACVNDGECPVNFQRQTVGGAQAPAALAFTGSTATAKSSMSY